MGSNAFRYLDEWVERANDIAPTILAGSKKPQRRKPRPDPCQAGLGVAVGRRPLCRRLGPDGTWKRDAPQNRRGPKLTTKMVARLRGWSGHEYEWRFSGPKTSRNRQIGNAFPPPVARAVGDSIAPALRMEGATGQVRPERRMHDGVYRVLRDRPEWITARRIASLCDSRLMACPLFRRTRVLVVCPCHASDARPPRVGRAAIAVRCRLAITAGLLGSEEPRST